MINIPLLDKICTIPGAPGFEQRIREFIIKEVTPLVDSVSTDAMGNVIAFKKGKEDKKVMMERARAMVKKMRDDGSDPNMQQSKKGDDVLKAGVSRKKRDRSRTKSGFKKK